MLFLAMLFFVTWVMLGAVLMVMASSLDKLTDTILDAINKDKK